jgi:DNA mismatch repair protein MutL
LLREVLPEINALGFDIQEFGNHDFVIHGMPADLKGGNEQQIVESLLEDYKQNLAVLKLDKRESLARSLARQTSIKAGQSLTVTEMKTLIDELFACDQPYIAPGGRQTISTFDFRELDGRFGAK